MLDEAFDPYIDIIVESSSFACRAVYMAKRNSMEIVLHVWILKRQSLLI